MSDENNILMCANCGKGEECSGDLKSCAACKLVKYCSRDCQIAHRPQHKKACKKRAAELHDEKLFNEPPPPEDCPICFLPLPYESSRATFHSCCGKIICIGCMYAIFEREGEKLCAFCRTPPANSHKEEVKRTKKLMEKGNGSAFYALAGFYDRGTFGMPQDHAMSNELLLKAGELGSADAYFNLGNAYERGTGVEIDKKKAKFYYELAAMNGDVAAMHNLGRMEGLAGNDQRAFKHYIIAARAGGKVSLDSVKRGYMAGIVTKEEYANILREYQKNQDEMKSEARDKAQSFYNIM